MIAIVCGPKNSEEIGLVVIFANNKGLNEKN